MMLSDADMAMLFDAWSMVGMVIGVAAVLWMGALAWRDRRNGL